MKTTKTYLDKLRINIMNNKTTVCIPSKLENLDFFLELIKSIENQTLLPDEILIIVSGRPVNDIKNSINFLKRKISNNLNCKFVISKKNGLSCARNLGIDLCENEIIIFGDDDDFWHKDKVRLTVKAIEKNKPCLVKHFHNSLKGQSLISVPLKVKPNPNPFSVGFSNLIGGGSAISGSLDVFKVIKFDNYKNCEDWDFWIRSFLAGIRIIQINKELVTYRIHANRMTSSFFSVYKFENQIRYRYLLRALFFIFGILVGFLKSTLRTFLRINLYSLKRFLHFK